MTEANKPFVVSNASDKLELTAYRGGNAVVRERRVVKLAEGTSRVALQGLPEQFVQGSLTIVNVEGRGKFKLGPISYRAANLSTQAILHNAIGQNIDFIEQTPSGIICTRGVLRHVLGQQVIIETTNGAMIHPITAKFELPNGLPKSLTVKPSLMMEPTVAEAGEFGINILYETAGVEWDARYEAFYNAKEEKIERLVCWVDLTNSSGGTLKDAKFKLIAQSNYGKGRVAGGAKMATAMAFNARGGGLEAAPMADFGAETGSAESVGEQKLYILPDALTLENGESKQAMLVLAENVPVTPEYFLQANGYFDYARGHDQAQKQPVFIRLRAKNNKASKLGVALPPGEMSVFETDSTGALQKTDTSRVGHVAEDESFKLTLQNACKDLKATRVLFDVKEDPAPTKPSLPVTPTEETPVPRFREETRELRLYNFKDKAVTVEVSEPVQYEWEFLEASEHFTAEAKKTGCISVGVPAKGETTVRYRIRYRLH